METLLKGFTLTEKHKSESAAETVKLAKKFAARLKENDVVALSGQLGAGKTHFIKGIASFFGADGKSVISPTFNIMKEYYGITMKIYHFDLYRLESHKELERIGFRDYTSDEGAICVAEWPEKVMQIAGIYDHVVKISHKGGDKREILFYERKGGKRQ